MEKRACFGPAMELLLKVKGLEDKVSFEQSDGKKSAGSKIKKQDKKKNPVKKVTNKSQV